MHKILHLCHLNNDENHLLSIKMLDGVKKRYQGTFIIFKQTCTFFITKKSARPSHKIKNYTNPEEFKKPTTNI